MTKLTFRTLALGTVAVMTASLANATVIAPIADYGTGGTAFTDQVYRSVFGSAAPRAIVENADSVDLISDSVGNFNVLILGSTPASTIDLTGFSGSSFFEIDLEILPIDDSSIIDFRYELFDAAGEISGTSATVDFDFSAIAGFPEDSAVPRPRVTPAPGPYTLTSTTTLADMGAAGVDLSTITFMELVYQAWSTESRSGVTFAMQVDEFRIIDPIPEPATVAASLLGLACLLSRRSNR